MFKTSELEVTGTVTSSLALWLKSNLTRLC